MHLRDLLHAFLAQQAPGGPGGGAGCAAAQILPLVLMFAVIYFLLIRPQQKQAKQHQTLLTGLKKGDEVVTQGGLVGRIHAVTDRIVTLEVARDVRVRVLKQQVAGLFNEAGESADDADKK